MVWNKFLTRNRAVCALSLIAVTSEGAQTSARMPYKTYRQIIDHFMFPADFQMKPETRKVGDDIFWKYNLEVSDPPQIILYEVEDPIKDIPATEGVGRPYEHLNEGRKLFIEGKYDEARATWLSGRARFGANFPHHRRLDYFIAQAYLTLARNKLKAKAQSLPREELANAATFLSWAYVRKADLSDALLDRLAPNNFTIYQRSTTHLSDTRWLLAQQKKA